MPAFIRHPKDFWSGIVFLFFGLSAIVIGQDYEMGTAGRMGPAYFPSVLGGMLSLVGAASLVRLEEMHAQAGLEPLGFGDERLLSGQWEAVTLQWIEEAANAITFGVTGAACLLDLDGVIVDGAVSRALLERLIAAMQEQMTRYSW